MIIASMRLMCVLLMTFISVQVMGQCGTIENMQASSFEEQYTLSTDYQRPETLYEIPVKWHFVGTSNGLLFADSAKVAEEFGLANQWYNRANINLYKCGSINYIRDNDFINFTKRVDEPYLCRVHDVPDVINIYFIPELRTEDGGSLCGYAYNLDVKQRLFMDNGCAYNGSTLTHEFGHVFSLLHTHSVTAGWEVVARTNCQTAGDMLCDTPADPELGSENVDDYCQYFGTEKDIQRKPYLPDPTNIMSYAPKVCRDSMTQGQLERMEAYYVQVGLDVLFCNSNPSSVDQDRADSQIKIHPNPSSHIIYISGMRPASHTQISDINGRSIWTGQSQSNKIELNVTAWPKGLYTLRVQNKSFTQISTFIKQ